MVLFQKPCQLFATQEPGFVKISFLMPKVSVNGLFQNTHLSKVHWNFNSFQSARIGSNPAPTTFKTYEKGCHWQQQPSFASSFFRFCSWIINNFSKGCCKGGREGLLHTKRGLFSDLVNVEGLYEGQQPQQRHSSHKGIKDSPRCTNTLCVL